MNITPPDHTAGPGAMPPTRCRPPASAEISRRRFLAAAAVSSAAVASGVWLWRNRSPSEPAAASSPNAAGPPEGRTGATGPGPREALFYEPLSGTTVRCRLCFRNCAIPDGRRGFCRVRENREGRLYSLVYARPSAIQIDPVEKEPQHHFLPGSRILCLGTAGCNFRCLHCHNWHMSQATPEELRSYNFPPARAVSFALNQGLPTISFTYNDPIVFYEYVHDVAREAKACGLRILWHTNGAINPEPLAQLLPLTDALTVDLKAVSEELLKKMSDGHVAPVLATLKRAREAGVWLEVVHLMVTGMNDDPAHTEQLCHWVAEHLGPDVPLHFSRFFPSYRYTAAMPTPVKRLEEAYETARRAGLHYVSIGNVPGHRLNSTFCPACERRIIHRQHFQVLENRVAQGRCGFCGHPIPGVWS